ncbi:MAG: hypothetical protein PHU21_14450, partial [Elusimicrobia bacterium]|nr:hypothetical protein [Elusimicrobiota bacterium]
MPTKHRPKTARPSLLLIELVPQEPERQFRTAGYPWLMGLARHLGWQASWIALGVRYEPTLRYRLAPGDLALLRAELKRLRPSAALINERLRPRQRRALQAAWPGGRLRYWPLEDSLDRLGETFAALVPEACGAVLRAPDLLARLRPVFQRRVLNDAPWALAPLIRVLFGAPCDYLRPVSSNPFYRSLRLPQRVMGCSFCAAAPPRGPARGAAAFAARVVAAACRQLPDRGERRFELR